MAGDTASSEADPFIPAGATLVSASKSWCVVSVPGESGEMAAAIMLIELLEKMHFPNTANVYQGTNAGQVVTYVSYRFA